jgi:hypothetical protein
VTWSSTWGDDPLYHPVNVSAPRYHPGHADDLERLPARVPAATPGAGPAMLAAELLGRVQAELPVIVDLGERKQVLVAAWLTGLRSACAARAEAEQARQRAAAAGAQTEDARAETDRVREAATHDLDQVRADAARDREEITGRLADAVARGQAAEQRLADAATEYAQARADAARDRDELHVALEDRGRILEESRAELRERAERDLAGARAELGQLHSADEAGPDAPGRRRPGRQPGSQ